MKKILILATVLFSVISCEKENPRGEIRFSGKLSHAGDTLFYDSAMFLNINFLSKDEIKTSYDLLDSAIYTRNMKVKILHAIGDKNSLVIVSDYIELEQGKYMLKKFEMTDNDGKVIFYTPYPEIPEDLDSVRLNSDLPYMFEVAKQPETFYIPVKSNLQDL